MRVNEKYDRKLLVEGNDDQHVIWALCEKFNISEVFDIIDCGGINNLYESIPIRFKQANIKTIGIIIDADINLSDRWKSVKNLLSNQGFGVPDNLPDEGLILSNRNVKVGVWIMPNNNITGMLEDFISFLVPQNDKLLPIVDDTLDIIESKRLNKYLPTHRSKARIHSWLSWQEEPGTPLGLSITKRYLTTDQECCNLLINWLQKLFIEK
jgi:hypothetical protein